MNEISNSCAYRLFCCAAEKKKDNRKQLEEQMKQQKTGLEETQERTHKISVTLSFKSVENLRKVSSLNHIFTCLNISLLKNVLINHAWKLKHYLAMVLCYLHVEVNPWRFGNSHCFH